MDYYSKDTLIAFEDLRTLIKEEIYKLIEEVKNKNPKPKPLSISEVAELYNVSKATIHNWMKQGIIKGRKMGKGRFFDREELEDNLTKYKHMEALEKKGLIQPRQKVW